MLETSCGGYQSEDLVGPMMKSLLSLSLLVTQVSVIYTKKAVEGEELIGLNHLLEYFD
jgi:hypothetical protein